MRLSVSFSEVGHYRAINSWHFGQLGEFTVFRKGAVSYHQLSDRLVPSRPGNTIEHRAVYGCISSPRVWLRSELGVGAGRESEE